VNEGLRQALMDFLGDRYEDGPRGVVLSPANERELLGTLRLIRERGGRVHRDALISRRRFDAVGEVDARSGIVEVGAGVKLAALEPVANAAELSLGPLSPGALALDVAELVEGPYAGMRAIPGGRLEPICAALTAVMPQGHIYTSRAAPRSATGPDLDAFFLGVRGYAGLVLGATLRLLPRPTTSRAVTYSFGAARPLVRALQRALDDGCWIERARAEQRGDRFLLEAKVIGNSEGVDRDLSSLAQRVSQENGRGAGHRIERAASASASPEREACWDAIEAALEMGAALSLYRLALDSAVVEGEVGGVPLAGPEAPGKLQGWGEVLAAVDPEGFMGGAG
jgi:FAD/FMN-containing dehydrogenase